MPYIEAVSPDEESWELQVINPTETSITWGKSHFVKLRSRLLLSASCASLQKWSNGPFDGEIECKNLRFPRVWRFEYVRHWRKQGSPQRIIKDKYKTMLQGNLSCGETLHMYAEPDLRLKSVLRTLERKTISRDIRIWSSVEWLVSLRSAACSVSKRQLHSRLLEALAEEEVARGETWLHWARADEQSGEKKWGTYPELVPILKMLRCNKSSTEGSGWMSHNITAMQNRSCLTIMSEIIRHDGKKNTRVVHLFLFSGFQKSTYCPLEGSM